MSSSDVGPPDDLPPEVAAWFVEQRAFWAIARANGEEPPDPDDYHP